MAPQPSTFESIHMMIVEDENGILRSIPDKPVKMRAQRWSNPKQLKGKDLVEYIDSEKHFSFSPYEYTPREMAKVRLYANARGILVDPYARGAPAGFTAWLVIIGPTLLPFITVPNESGKLQFAMGDEATGI